MSGRDNWRVAFLFLVAATCAGFAAWNLWVAFHPIGSPPCTISGEPADHGTIDRGWYLLGLAIALLAGRVIGRGRGRTRRRATGQLTTPAGTALSSETDLRDHLGLSSGSPNHLPAVATAVTIQALIVMFVGVALFALLYETVGVAGGNDPWPITFLVRCLNEGSTAHVTSASTLAATMATGFLIGSWFWPERSGIGAPGI